MIGPEEKTMAFAANTRPIAGAVATVGVDERVAFLRRVYGTLGVAILGYVATAYIFIEVFEKQAFEFTRWAFAGQFNWIMLLIAFMAIGYGAEKLARSDSSRGMQYVGLTLGVIMEAIIVTPLLFIASHYIKDPNVIQKAGVVTLLVFAGLTGTVFITKKDFTFMRGALMVGGFAALGVILASALFGFHLGTVFVVAMIALMAGFVLYQTSLVMKSFGPTQHVSAALMLFGTLATMFFYVLQLFMSFDRD
jgi:FtsH-binding integral membrane protein